jgi:RNA polymerase sigma factor (sigma-70 family)
MQSVNKEFLEAVENKYYMSILYKVCNTNLKTVCTKDEIKSIALSTLWNCIAKYNSTRGVAKFSSYLYRSAENNTRRLYKKKIKIQNTEIEIQDNYCGKTQENNRKAKEEAFEILDSVKDLDPELHDILVKKFYYNMTNREIGQANGYGKETARKKVKKAIELCRKIVYN